MLANDTGALDSLVKPAEQLLKAFVVSNFNTHKCLSPPSSACISQCLSRTLHIFGHSAFWVRIDPTQNYTLFRPPFSTQRGRSYDGEYIEETSIMPTVTAIAVTPGDPESIHRIQHKIPDPGPKQVLIDVIRCGICGTDREVASGHAGALPQGSSEIILGHEVLGRVNTTGQDVTDFSPGDLVTATVRRPDGCPSCQAGQVDMCQWHQYTEHGIQGLHGYLTSQIVLHAAYVIPVPQNLEDIGVLIEPLTIVEKAVRQAMSIQRRMAIWEPKTAVVTGAGPVGILGTLLLRSRGMDVYTVARTPAPNAAASVIKSAGAHYVSTHDEDLDALAKRIGNIDLMLECTGASQVAFETMRVLGTNGVLVLLSLSNAEATMEVPVGAINNGVVTGNKVIVGSVNAGHEDFEAAASTLDTFEKTWPNLVGSIITNRVPFDGDLSGILNAPKDAIKTVVEFDSHHDRQRRS